MTRAHPRSRGENSGTASLASLPRGSSPLTRGKHSEALHGLAQGRLIPAHAGKTRPWLRVCGVPEAHPRSRGENSSYALRARIEPGSSPLTRGKQGVGLIGDGLDGLIPAHAGKTARCRWAHLARPAHPRSRGENSTGVARGGRPRGSSPLTRGKPRPEARPALDAGLIPAHAGKTCP